MLTLESAVRAQTVANFYLAFAQGLQLVPVINKVDLPSADPPRALGKCSRFLTTASTFSRCHERYPETTSEIRNTSP